MKTKCLIYCTKRNNDLIGNLKRKHFYLNVPKPLYEDIDNIFRLNGKVVARFECDKVEETSFQQEESFSNEIEKTLKDSCLTYDELWNYVKNTTFYKIHISNLEMFDKPKKLSEFKQPRDSYGKVNWNTNEYYYTELTKAPQNMCWVEYEGKRYCLISIRPEWVAKILNGEKTIEVRKKVLKGML